MDQKANSIADIAAVLIAREKANAGEKAEGKVKGTGQGEALAIEEKQIAESPGSTQASEDTRQGDEVRILWADILDAEYAETWPDSVLHDGMDFSGKRGKGARRVAPIPRASPEEIAAGQGATTSDLPSI